MLKTPPANQTIVNDNMSDTPETDAAVKESSKWRRPLISCSYNEITWDGPVTALCRKLERERDRALESLKNANKGAERLAKSNQFLMSEIIKCRKERDNLQERLDGFLQTRP